MSFPASCHVLRYFMISVIVASSICREQDNIPVKVVWRPLDQPWSQVPVLLKMRFVSFVALFVAARTGGARQICTKSSLIICKTLTGKKRLSRNLREQNSIRIKLLRDEWWRGENGNNKFESVHLQGEGECEVIWERGMEMHSGCEVGLVGLVAGDLFWAPHTLGPNRPPLYDLFR